MTIRTVGLAMLSAFTAGMTALTLITAEANFAHRSTPQVAVLHETSHAAVPSPLPKPPIVVPTRVPVDNPTALQVAGNPRLFVGSHVHWMCTIDIVPEQTFADAYCGPHVPRFAQPPLTADQMQNDPEAVAQSIRQGESSLHRAIHALSNRALIILTGPIQDLDHGEVITIDGTVRRPIHGENAFGITRAYPTVHVDSMVQ